MPAAAALSAASLRPRRSRSRTPAASSPSESPPASAVRAPSPSQPRETAMVRRKARPASTATPPSQASTLPPRNSSRSISRRAGRGKEIPPEGVGAGGAEATGGVETAAGGRRPERRGAAAISATAPSASRLRRRSSSVSVRASSAAIRSSTIVLSFDLLTIGRQRTNLSTAGQQPIDHRLIRWTHLRPRLHPARRGRAPPAAARARRGPVHALRVRRALDGPDRQGGRDLEGAALPLLPLQGGVLRRHAGGEGGGARAAHGARPRAAPAGAALRLARRLPALGGGERRQLREDDPLGERARGAPHARPRARRDGAAH